MFEKTRSCVEKMVSQQKQYLVGQSAPLRLRNRSEKPKYGLCARRQVNVNCWLLGTQLQIRKLRVEKLFVFVQEMFWRFKNFLEVVRLCVKPRLSFSSFRRKMTHRTDSVRAKDGRLKNGPSGQGS